MESNEIDLSPSPYGDIPPLFGGELTKLCPPIEDANNPIENGKNEIIVNNNIFLTSQRMSSQKPVSNNTSFSTHCLECIKPLQNTAALMVHIFCHHAANLSTHQSPSVYMCSYNRCNQRTHTIQNLMDHITNTHSFTRDEDFLKLVESKTLISEKEQPKKDAIPSKGLVRALRSHTKPKKFDPYKTDFK